MSESASTTPASQDELAKSNRRIIKWIVGLWFLAIVVALAFQAVTQGPKKALSTLTPEPKYSDWFIEQLESDISDMQRLGVLVRVEPSMNQAYVNAIIWAGVNIDAKTTIAKKLAQYCEAKGQSQRIRILDYQSGRELATFSSSWGLEVK